MSKRVRVRMRNAHSVFPHLTQLFVYLKDFSHATSSWFICEQQYLPTFDDLVYVQHDVDCTDGFRD